MNNLVSTITSLNKEVSYKSLNDLLSLTTFEKLPKKIILCKEGEIPEDVYFIKSGIIRAYITNASGIEFNQAFFFDDNFAGAFSALTQKKPSKITLECLTNCEVLRAKYYEVGT